jgi:lysophospholipase L1-like esterase
MKFTRFIVCGDSYSEGMTDEMVNGQYRGWGDRVADGLAKEVSNFEYSNLAIRGKLLKEVIDNQLPTAISYVTGPETLLSFHAGANDALRPNYKSEIALPLYEAAVRKAAATGATLILFSVLERTGNTGKGSDLWAARFGEFNKTVRKVGADVGAIVVDANEEAFFNDRRFLAFDRLHLNEIGHDRCAQAVLEKLGYQFDSSWRKPLPPAKPELWIKKRVRTAIWFFTFALPWIWRRLRGKSSGDGRSAKYPTLTAWPLR